MVLLDIDGVVVDFVGGMGDYLFYKKGIHFIREGVKDYNWTIEEYGCKRSDIFEAMCDTEFWEGLKLFSRAEVAVKKLKLLDDVFPYTVIPETRGRYIISLREKLLESLDLDSHVYTTDKPYMSDAKALFEDRLETCVEWMQKGYKGCIYVIAQPYNNLTEEATRLAYENGTYLKRVSDLYEGVIDYAKVQGTGRSDK